MRYLFALLWIIAAFGQTTPAVNTPDTKYNMLDYGIVAGDVDTAGANSTAMLALLSTVNTAGGGTITAQCGTYRFDSQLLFPNSGVNGTQSNIRLTGAGGGPGWEEGGGVGNMQTGCVILDLRYQGNNNGKIETEGFGVLQIDNLTLQDKSTAPSFSTSTGSPHLTNIVVTGGTAVITFAGAVSNGQYKGASWLLTGSATTALNGLIGITAVSGNTLTFTTTAANGTYTDMTLQYSAPMVHTTLTNVDIHDNIFVGNSADQSFVVLGGNSTTDTDQNAPMNAYSSTVHHNSFAFGGRAFYCRTFCANVAFENNTFVRHGVALTALECDGTLNTNSGLMISNNLIEGDYMDSTSSLAEYGIKFINCTSNSLIANGFFDVGHVTSFYRFQNNSYHNTVALTAVAGTVFSDDDSGTSLGTTTIYGGDSRTGVDGYGALTSQIPYGQTVRGNINTGVMTTGYPGQLNVIAQSSANTRLSIGASNTGANFFIDAYTIGTGAGVLKLNPNGGDVNLSNGTLISNVRKRSFGATFTNNGSALASGATTYFTVPYACTISAWNITVSPADTATIDIWKIATGTAIPTVTNTITASATPAISTGTAIHSTTLTGWSTGVNVSANDIMGVNLKAVGGTATQAALNVECDQ